MIKQTCKSLLPRKIIDYLYSNYISTREFILPYFLKGNNFSCPFCQKSFSKMLPSGVKIKVLEKYKVIGGRYRNNSLCPACSSNERSRLIYLYINEKNLLKRGDRVLHIAPEKNLKNYLNNLDIDYIAGDLQAGLADKIIDVRQMNFPDDYFDALLCNHVLEHVEEDLVAIGELYRVLKPGGWAIMQVPTSTVLKRTREDPSVTNPADRLKTFGQSDHVRIYQRYDYIKRLEAVGFQVNLKNLDNRMLLKKYALDSEESIYLLTKKID